MKKVSCYFTGIGLLILVVMVFLALRTPDATDMVSAIPPTILGASLFISGYLGMVFESKNTEISE